MKKNLILSLMVISILLLFAQVNICNAGRPIVKIETPQNDNYVNGVIPIIFSVIDEDLVKVNLMINNVTVMSWRESGKHTYYWNTANYPDGEYIIMVIAYDEEENISYDKIIVVVDNIKATASITNLKPYSYVKGTINVEGFLFSDEATFGKASLRLNNIVINSWNKLGLWNIKLNTNNFKDGKYELNIIAWDKSGRFIPIHGNTKLTIIIDNTNPRIRILNPKSNAELTGIVKISWNAYDVNLAKIMLTISNQKLIMNWDVTGMNSYNLNTALMADGQYILKITAIDKAGNIASQKIPIKIVNTLPLISKLENELNEKDAQINNLNNKVKELSSHINKLENQVKNALQKADFWQSTATIAGIIASISSGALSILGFRHLKLMRKIKSTIKISHERKLPGKEPLNLEAEVKQLLSIKNQIKSLEEKLRIVTTLAKKRSLAMEICDKKFSLKRRSLSLKDRVMKYMKIASKAYNLTSKILKISGFDENAIKEKFKEYAEILHVYDSESKTEVSKPNFIINKLNELKYQYCLDHVFLTTLLKYYSLLKETDLPKYFNALRKIIRNYIDKLKKYDEIERLRDKIRNCEELSEDEWELWEAILWLELDKELGYDELSMENYKVYYLK